MLSASVGQSGFNRPNDTRTIQGLLSDLRLATGLNPLTIDGIVGPKTIGAIMDFQMSQFSLPRDGRIDPDGPTLSKLDEVCAGLYQTIILDNAPIILGGFRHYPIKISGIPPQLIHKRSLIQAEIFSLVPATSLSGGKRFSTKPFYIYGRRRSSPAQRRSNLLGVALVDDLVIILVIFFLLLLLIVANPIWQRAAKQMIEETKKKLKLMMEKLVDAIKDMIDAIESTLEGTECEEACLDERQKLKDLAKELEDLINSMPANDNDPEALKAKKFQLVRIHDKILQAQQAVIDCLAQHGC